MVLSVLGVSSGNTWRDLLRQKGTQVKERTCLDDRFQRLPNPSPNLTCMQKYTLSHAHSHAHFFRPHYNVIIIDRVGQRAISMKDRVKGC